MANMMKMMKQVKQVRKLQKELGRKIVEVSSNDGSVTVVACGDMSIKSIKLDAASIDPAKSERLAKLITSTVNGALTSAKKAAASDMSQLSEGLGDLLGGKSKA